MAQQPKHIKGDGINTPDLKLFVGAYMTVTYWQADPKNNKQSTIHIKSDGGPADSSLVIHPSNVDQLAQVLSFINQQIY